MAKFEFDKLINDVADLLVEEVKANSIPKDCFLQCYVDHCKAINQERPNLIEYIATEAYKKVILNW